MKLVEHGHQFWAKLTYDEETALAQSVMDTLCLRWISNEFSSVLRRLYEIKTTHGYDLIQSDLLELVSFYDFYQLEFPELIANGRELPLETRVGKRDLTPDEAILNRRRTILRCWYDVWTEHAAFREVADEFKVFPGLSLLNPDQKPSTGLLETRMTENRAFWQEVDRVVQTMGISKTQAILLVRDYLPHHGILEKKEEPGETP